MTSSCAIRCVDDMAAGRKKDTVIKSDFGRNQQILVGKKRALEAECRTGNDIVYHINTSIERYESFNNDQRHIPRQNSQYDGDTSTNCILEARDRIVSITHNIAKLGTAKYTRLASGSYI